MISVFYASLSVVAALVVGLVGGAILGVRLWIKFSGGMDRLFHDPAYRNTAGAVWVLGEVYRMINDDCTIDDLRQWVDEKGDDYAEGMKTPEVGARIVGLMDPSPCEDCDDEDLERLAMQLAGRIGAVRGKKGRDHIRKLRFGTVLDELDSAHCELAATNYRDSEGT